MTIKELKEKIKDMPDNLDVFIERSGDDEYRYNMAETAVFRKVKFYDEDLEGEANVFIISSI